jgi:threonine/homoserine/homoserine lactone efflux protein
MLSLSYFKGCAVGLTAAAPIGGISILCIRRTLAEGWLCGIVSGLGVATADGFYSLIAGMGAASIVPFLERYQNGIQILAGVLLCAIACKIALTLPTAPVPPVQGSKLLNRYSSMLALTLADPIPIFLAILVFAGIQSTHHLLQAVMLSLGVFSGSMLWWLLLSSICTLLHINLKQVYGRISQPITHPTAIKWLNRSIGATLFGYGIHVLTR